MAVPAHDVPLSLRPSLGRAFLGGVFAMFWLTVLTALLLGGSMMLLVHGITSVAP